MSEQEQDKTEKATPHKLREAHKRGEVSKSQDVASASMLLAFTVVFAATAPDVASALAGTFETLVPAAGRPGFTLGQLFSSMATALEPVLIALSPLIIALLITAVLGTVLQTGIVFSSHPLKPDFNRLNPALGMKKFFNLRVLFELFKVALKLGLVSCFLYFGSRWLLPETVGIGRLDPETFPGRLLELCTLAGLVLAAIFLFVAVLDLAFSRYEFARRMRMSRRDLKDEHKKREGDPEVKSRRRQKQQEMRKRASSIARVVDSDVVLVNPTHIAIALQYRPARMRAPEIRALGAGLMAQAIRDEARRHGVPIVRNITLARELFRSARIDHPIKEEHFDALAPIYRWLMTRPNCKVMAP